jgi:hypothetical protein
VRARVARKTALLHPLVGVCVLGGVLRVCGVLPCVGDLKKTGLRCVGWLPYAQAEGGCLGAGGR